MIMDSDSKTMHGWQSISGIPVNPPYLGEEGVICQIVDSEFCVPYPPHPKVDNPHPKSNSKVFTSRGLHIIIRYQVHKYARISDIFDVSLAQHIMIKIWLRQVQHTPGEIFEMLRHLVLGRRK